MSCPLALSYASQVDFSSRPFKLWTSSKEVTADTVILATGAVAKRMEFPGSDEANGFWWV
jgi:thioredoxin reductase (NADPH)